MENGGPVKEGGMIVTKHRSLFCVQSFLGILDSTNASLLPQIPTACRWDVV